MAEPVSSLLRRSVEHLAEAVPASYRLMVDALGSLVVALEVDGERFSLIGGDRLTVTDVSVPADVSIGTSRPVIVAVLDAEVSLQDAIDVGTVNVRGSLNDVVRTHDTLRAYVHAAARAPAQAELIDALRAAPT